MNHDPEMVVLLALAEAGLGARAIAAQLGCGTDDVRRHLAEAIRAFSASSVPDAVQIAIRRGLIDSPDRVGRPA